MARDDLQIIKKGYSRDRYTPSQYQELAKCMVDPIYFIEKYMMIQHAIQGRVPFKMYPFQHRMIRAMHENRYTILMTSRQIGKTTCAAGYLLWKAMFSADSTILIAANIYVSAFEIMEKIRFAYENLEQYNWLRAGVTEYNKGSIVFDNGSRIISRATTQSAGRGLAITVLYLDEFSFVLPRIAEEFWAAMSPTLATGGACIITSTPNSDEDQFAQIWHGANENFDDTGQEIAGGVGRNGFFPVKVKWDEHPDRDGKWAIEQRMKIGNDRFLREFEAEFIIADQTLINGMTLQSLTAANPLFNIDDIRWYAEPEANHVYGVALDPAMGTGGGDFAAIQIFDLSTMTQIAEWRDTKTRIDGQIQILLKILYFIYQTMDLDSRQEGEPEIYWSVENNTLGEAALLVIEQVGEENFPGYFVHEPKKSGGGGHRKGLYTGNKSKLSACSRVKKLIESNKMQIKSKPLISELKTFVRGDGSYKAKSGSHDDLVMATMLIIRIFQIVSGWETNINSSINEDFSIDDMTIEPMPIIM
jgi:hypothetical protein